MKRSEAVKLIYETMKDNHFGQYGEFYKMANSVLEVLENEGIEPPLRKNPGYCSCGNPDSEEYTWDEE